MLILNDAELMSRPLVVKTIGIGLGPILTLTGTALGFVTFFQEFIARCMFKWELTLAGRSKDSEELFSGDGVQSWLTSVAWTESLMFSITLFFFTTSVCWIGLLYRYAKLDAFAVHRAVLVGLEVDDEVDPHDGVGDKPKLSTQPVELTSTLEIPTITQQIAPRKLSPLVTHTPDLVTSEF